MSEHIMAILTLFISKIMAIKKKSRNLKKRLHFYVARLNSNKFNVAIEVNTVFVFNFHYFRRLNLKKKASRVFF